MRPLGTDVLNAFRVPANLASNAAFHVGFPEIARGLTKAPPPVPPPRVPTTIEGCCVACSGLTAVGALVERGSVLVEYTFGGLGGGGPGRGTTAVSSEIICPLSSISTISHSSVPAYPLQLSFAQSVPSIPKSASASASSTFVNCWD